MVTAWGVPTCTLTGDFFFIYDALRKNITRDRSRLVTLRRAYTRRQSRLPTRCLRQSRLPSGIGPSPLASETWTKTRNLTRKYVQTIPLLHFGGTKYWRPIPQNKTRPRCCFSLINHIIFQPLNSRFARSQQNTDCFSICSRVSSQAFPLVLIITVADHRHGVCSTATTEKKVEPRCQLIVGAGQRQPQSVEMVFDIPGIQKQNSAARFDFFKVVSSRVRTEHNRGNDLGITRARNFSELCTTFTHVPETLIKSCTPVAHLPWVRVCSCKNTRKRVRVHTGRAFIYLVGPTRNFCDL